MGKKNKKNKAYVNHKEGSMFLLIKPDVSFPHSFWDFQSDFVTYLLQQMGSNF